MCDNRTVTKYSGEISDFKMRIRRQMLKDNLIDGDKSLAQVPIVPLPLAPVVVLPVKKETEEDMIRRARLELADLAIAKQRARQEAQGKSGVDVSSNAANEGVPSSEEGKVEEDEETARKRIEKETAKAKKKAEKEVIFLLRFIDCFDGDMVCILKAIALREKLEEEDREKRRLEKQKDMEEARLLVEQQQKLREQWAAEKEIKEAAKRLKEQEEAAELERLKQIRREEREAKKQVSYVYPLV
jgi:hypothetical protein